MAKLNLAGYVLILILIMFLIQLLATASDIAKSPELGTINEQNMVNQKLEGSYGSIDKLKNETGKIVGSYTETSSMSSPGGSISDKIFIDSGFNFMTFIDNIPKMVWFMYTGIGWIGGMIPGASITIKILMILMLIPLHMFSYYILMKILLGSNRID